MAVKGADVHTVAGDVTDPEAISRLVKATLARFGQLDILVTNGGGPAPGKFADLSERDWQAGLDNTLWPVLRLIRAAVPHLTDAKERGGGRIINIVSTSVKQPIPGLFLSNALRPAVIGLAKSLSVELAADGILVNNVCPGSFDTDRIKHVYEARAEGTPYTVEQIAEQAAQSIPPAASGRPARARQRRRLPRFGQSELPDGPDALGGWRPGQRVVRLNRGQLPMNDQASVLFTMFDDSINYHARHIATEVRKIVSAHALSPEQQEALNVALRSELESLIWSLLGPFDNVGCSLPDGVSGYSIRVRASDPAKPGAYEPLPEADIREDAEDYADMWQDFIAARTPAD